MILNFDELIQKHNLNIKGVLSIGAHYGEEYLSFERHNIKNICFFEPLPHVYEILREKVPKKEGIHFLQVALSNYNGCGEMWVETKNNSQSSSLLEPKKHLEYYPDIKFEHKENVIVRRLDDININKNLYNAIWADIQGAELLMLKGAEKTLQYIDYIYLEVNFGELYKDCALIGDIDKFLAVHGFIRTETGPVSNEWTDALYIKKKKQSIVNVPIQFRLNENSKYPPDNKIPFEEYFYDKYCVSDINTDWVYLPVLWTSYYCNNNYGQNNEALHVLQEYLDNLPDYKKVFTIVQYDDGILNKLKFKNLLIFQMGSLDYNQNNQAKIIPIPLMGNSRKTYLTFEDKPKKYFASFIGRFNTHPIREKMRKALQGKQGYYIIDLPTPVNEYCRIINESLFVLAPRGYGVTSFRIWEAIELGAIPVYISDRFHRPFKRLFYYGIEIIENEIENIHEILTEIASDKERIKNLQESVKEAYQNIFNYEQCFINILEYL